MNKISTKLNLLLFVYFYSLFGLRRFKYMYSFQYNESSINNIIILIFIVLFILLIMNFRNINIKLSFMVVTIIYFFVYVLTLSYSKSLIQSIYAMSIFVLPILVVPFAKKFNKKEQYIFSIVNLYATLFYSILAIFMTVIYDKVMLFLGNDLTGQDQVRASLMIGSSITVSYFFLISIVYILYSFNAGIIRNSKIIFITVILSGFAILVNLSRLSTVVLILLIIYFLITKNKFRKTILKPVFIILIVSISIIMLYNFDFSRLIIGFDFSSTSETERWKSIILAYEIFKDNILIGSGYGQHFERLSNLRTINYQGFYGLIEPHNAFMLLLSETGVIGIILFFVFISLLLLTAINKSKMQKEYFYLILFAIFLISLGGSHLINEPNFSVIFWIYIGIILNDKHIIRELPNESQNDTLCIKKWVS